MNAPAKLGAGDLEPQVRAFVEQVIADTERRGPARSPSERRRIAEAVRAPWAAGGPEMAETRDLAIPFAGRSVRARLLRPKGAPSPSAALLYLHGGGWALFSLETHDRLMREYAARSAITVVGLEYSLSPEARFPTALQETGAAIAWLAREADALRVDAAKLFVGGDSAGANLALSAAIAARGGGGPNLAGALLNYGAFAPPVSDEAIARHGGPGAMLTGAEMAAFWADYLGRPEQATDPRAAPLLADLAGLPPVMLAVPEADILSEQSLELARRLDEARVDVTCAVYPGAAHSFLEAVSISPVANRALDEAAAWLRVKTLGAAPE